MEDMERVLSCARLSEQAGPGLRFMFPESINMSLTRNVVDLCDLDGYSWNVLL